MNQTNTDTIIFIVALEYYITFSRTPIAMYRGISPTYDSSYKYLQIAIVSSDRIKPMQIATMSIVLAILETLE